MPRRFGRYEIREEVSRGGMGVVYRAWDSGLNREVALKVLLGGAEASPESIERFRREAKSIAALRHPNIVPIHDIGVEDGCHYFTMDFVEGENLQTRIEGGRLDEREAVRIVGEVATAIHWAHEHGVIHRDIKPHNILLTPAGKPLIMDFGLARTVESDTRITQTGLTLGTPPYMSPEQARGLWDEVGPQSDVYSLGATLFETLCGRPPFLGESGMDILLKVVEEDPPRPRSLNPSISAPVETMILKSLDKDPDRRYSTSAELAVDARRFLDGLRIVARPPRGPFNRGWRKIRRFIVSHLLLALPALAGGVAAVVGGAALLTYYQARTQDRQRYVPVVLPIFPAPNPAVPVKDAPPQVRWEALEGSFEKMGKEGTGFVLKPAGDAGRCVVVNVTERFRAFDEGALLLRFDVVLRSDRRGPPPEAGCFFYVEDGRVWDTGYRFVLGQGFGGRCALLKNGRELRSAGHAPLGSGSRLFGLGRAGTRVTVRIYRDRLGLDLDGSPVFDVRDDFPGRVEKSGGCLWGFYVTGAELEITGIEPARLGPPLVSDALSTPDAFYIEGNLETARKYYRRVYDSYRDQPQGLLARYRMALCQYRLAARGGPADGIPEAVRELEALVAKDPTDPSAARARLFLAQHWAALGEGRKALDLLDAVMKRHPQEEWENRAALLALAEGEDRVRAAGAPGPAVIPPEGLSTPADQRTLAAGFLEGALRGGAADPQLVVRAHLLLGDLALAEGNSDRARSQWVAGARMGVAAPLDALHCGIREALHRRLGNDDAGARASLLRLREDFAAIPLLAALPALELGRTARKVADLQAALADYGAAQRALERAGASADLQAWALAGAAAARTEAALATRTSAADLGPARKSWEALAAKHGRTPFGLGTALLGAFEGDEAPASAFELRGHPPDSGLFPRAARLLEEYADRLPGAPKTPDRPGPFAFLASFMTGEERTRALAERLVAEILGERPNSLLLYWAGLRFELLEDPDRALACHRASLELGERDFPSPLVLERIRALERSR